MTDAREPPDRTDEVATDLVQYVVVTVPDQDALATVVPALAELVETSKIRIIRVQMIMLAGFILTFVGAGMFTIANGTPLLPLQILWINFAIDVRLAIGLGFDAPTPGLMKRRPRSPDEPVIAPALTVRLGVGGLLIAIGTLAVVAWAEDRYGLAVATTMGLTTISLLHIVAALEWRDPVRSIFNRDTIANGRFNLLMLAALALTYLVTTLSGLQRIFDTVELTGSQWRACFIAAISYLALAELGKFVFRRIDREASDGRADINTNVKL